MTFFAIYWSSYDLLCYMLVLTGTHTWLRFLLRSRFNRLIASFSCALVLLLSNELNRFPNILHAASSSCLCLVHHSQDDCEQSPAAEARASAHKLDRSSHAVSSSPGSPVSPHSSDQLPRSLKFPRFSEMLEVVGPTADSREYMTLRFQKQEVGSWKLEVGFSQLCTRSLFRTKIHESFSEPMDKID